MVLVEPRSREDVIQQTHRHWWAMIQRALVPTVLLIGTIASGLGIAISRPGWLTPWPIPVTGALFVIPTIAVAWLIWIYVDWLDDGLIITTERVIWLERTLFLNERRREIPLNRVQNVSFATNGLIQYWLKFGVLRVDAAGGPPIVADDIPQPNYLRELITRQRDQVQARYRQAQDDALTQAVRTAIAPPTDNGQGMIAPASAPDPGSASPDTLEPIHTAPGIQEFALAALPPLVFSLLALVGLSQLSRPLDLRPEVIIALLIILTGLTLIGLGWLIWSVLVWLEKIQKSQQPTSTQIVIWHRHWWFLLRDSLRPSVLCSLTLIGLTQYTRLPGLRGELVILIATALLLLTIIGVGWLIWEILSWREDIYEIDGNRLRDKNLVPLGLRQQVTETLLDRIQDVSYTIPHFWAYLLDYGDVLILTAGESQQFTFDGVAHPRQVYDEISDRLAGARELQISREREAARRETLDLIQTYHRLTHQQDTPDQP